MSLLYSFIGPITDASVSEFIHFMELNPQPKYLRLNISSLGGGVTPAITMYNYLKSLPYEVITHNIGEISSAAVLVYLAGKTRTAEDISTFMIHPISMGAPENCTYYKIQEILNGIENYIKNYASIVNKETGNLQNYYGDIENYLKNESLHFDKQSAHRCGIVTQI